MELIVRFPRNRERIRALLAIPCLLLMVASGVFVWATDPPKPDRQQQKPGDAASFSERQPRYRIRKGDTFELNFTYAPELNQSIPVQPDGFITLKNAGTIFVEGQTLPELTKTIDRAYSDLLSNPEFTITLKDFEKPYFIVGGQVAKPGKYDLRSDTTVIEALEIAGGLTAQSKHSQVVLFRPVNADLVEARLLDVKKMLASRNLNEDLHLRVGDMIFVPQNAISKISKYLPTQSVGINLAPYYP